MVLVFIVALCVAQVMFTFYVFKEERMWRGLVMLLPDRELSVWVRNFYARHTTASGVVSFDSESNFQSTEYEHAHILSTQWCYDLRSSLDQFRIQKYTCNISRF